MGDSFERPDADNAVAPLLYIHHNYDGAHDDDDDDDDGPTFISIMFMMLPTMMLMKMLDLPLYPSYLL